MRVLVAVLGENDPHRLALGGKSALRGPLLSLLAQREFDEIVCVMPAPLAARRAKIRAALGSRRVSFHTLADVTPTTLAAVWPAQGEVFAMSSDSAHEEALILAHPHFTLLRVLLPPRVTENAAVVEAAVTSGSSVGTTREAHSDYAVSFEQPAFRILGRTGARDAATVAREVGLIGKHASFLRETEKAALIAPHAVPVLIQGETGSGKGVMARFIHQLSERRDQPFVAVNCGALPANLIESLLFGHVKGAFTGAHVEQAGKFALADGGVLFLDEIGELPLELQPKLLRVLEDGVVEPLGASRGRKVDVRIIAATHRDLKSDVVERRFREDLFYRLTFATIDLPALRERRSDIPAIAEHILDKVNRRLQRPKALTPAAADFLARQFWRGNVRDLENVIGRSALLTRRDTLDAKDIRLDEVNFEAKSAVPEPYEGFSMEDYLASVRAELMDRALKKSNGNKSAAARLLGVSPQAVSKFAQPH